MLQVFSPGYLCPFSNQNDPFSSVSLVVYNIFSHSHKHEMSDRSVALTHTLDSDNILVLFPAQRGYDIN